MDLNICGMWGQILLATRLLTKRFGEIAPETRSRISDLSEDKLENLLEFMPELTNINDLVNWLDSQ